jgi:hypothetical protein
VSRSSEFGLILGFVTVVTPLLRLVLRLCGQNPPVLPSLLRCDAWKSAPPGGKKTGGCPDRHQGGSSQIKAQHVFRTAVRRFPPCLLRLLGVKNPVSFSGRGSILRWLGLLLLKLPRFHPSWFGCVTLVPDLLRLERSNRPCLPWLLRLLRLCYGKCYALNHQNPSVLPSLLRLLRLLRLKTAPPGERVLCRSAVHYVDHGQVLDACATARRQQSLDSHSGVSLSNSY